MNFRLGARQFFELNAAKPTDSDYLYFVAASANTTIHMPKVGSPTVTPSLEWSMDKATWTNWTPNSDTLTLANVGDKVYFRNRGTQTALASGGANYWPFRCTSGTVRVGGYVNSLLDKDNYKSMTTLEDFALTGLFRENTGLVDASDLILSAANLGNRSYASMFRECTGLVHGPKSWEPPYSFADYSCAWMFQGCTSLLDGPCRFINGDTLPTPGVFHQMYYGCTMFASHVVFEGGVISSMYAYSSMFQDCTSLTEITVEWERWGTSTYVNLNWVEGVPSGGTFHKRAELLTAYGTSNIPPGWTILNDVL